MLIKKSLIKKCSILIMALFICGCTSNTDTDINNKEQTEDKKDNGETSKTGDNKTDENKIPSFTTKDLEGNTVTDSIFSEKDLTVVNIWGTFCGPCIGEMPELAEWSESMPSNVQIIGLVCDIEGEDDQEHKDKAKEIMEKAGADFTNLIPKEGLDSLLSGVTGVPTTMFVDKNGNITGKAVVGANVEAYKEFVEDYINAE